MGLYNDVIKKYYSGNGIIVNLYLRGRILLFDFKKILDFVPKNTKTINDIGCGYGFLDFMLGQRFKNAKVFASDLNCRRIKFLREVNTNKNIKFDCVDATKSKINGDLIICVDLLHHITYNEQEKLLEKLHKNTSRSATILIKDMHNPRFSVSYVVSYFIDIISAKQYPIYFRDKKNFAELFEKKGFKVVKIAHLNRWFVPLNHVLFVLKKK